MADDMIQKISAVKDYDISETNSSRSRISKMLGCYTNSNGSLTDDQCLVEN